MKAYAAQAFEIYFKKSVIDAAYEVEIKKYPHLYDDCQRWLSDLEIIEDRRNERTKNELENKIQSLFEHMGYSIREQIERVFTYADFNQFLDEYFSSPTNEYKIGKYFAVLEDENNEELQKIAQLAKDNKDLATQLLIGKKVI